MSSTNNEENRKEVLQANETNQETKEVAPATPPKQILTVAELAFHDETIVKKEAEAGADRQEGAKNSNEGEIKALAHLRRGLTILNKGKKEEAKESNVEKTESVPVVPEEQAKGKGQLIKLVERVFKSGEASKGNEAQTDSENTEVTDPSNSASEPIESTEPNETTPKEAETKEGGRSTESKPFLHSVAKLIGRGNCTREAKEEKRGETEKPQPADQGTEITETEAKVEKPTTSKPLLQNLNNFLRRGGNNGEAPVEKVAEAKNTTVVEDATSEEVSTSNDKEIPKTPTKKDAILDALLKKTNKMVHTLEETVHKVEAKLHGHKEDGKDENKAKPAEDEGTQVTEGREEEGVTAEKPALAGQIIDGIKSKSHEVKDKMVEKKVDSPALEQSENSQEQSSPKWKNRLSGYFKKNLESRESSSSDDTVTSAAPESPVKKEEVKSTTEQTVEEVTDTTESAQIVVEGEEAKNQTSAEI